MPEQKKRGSADPDLDSAWAIRTKMRADAMVLWDESNRLKKLAEREMHKRNAIADKAQARAPWKSKGLYIKQRNVANRADNLKRQSTEIRKKGDVINVRANEQWNDAVMRICGVPDQDWTRTKEGAYTCTLENGLQFTTN